MNALWKFYLCEAVKEFSTLNICNFEIRRSIIIGTIIMISGNKM